LVQSSALTASELRAYPDQLRAALAPAQLNFLSRLKTSLTFGRFLKAGVRPGVPLDQQSEEDLLWIRDEFFNSDADFGKIVVHGPTPIAEPNLRPNRINIDTGASATSQLTCLLATQERIGHLIPEGDPKSETICTIVSPKVAVSEHFLGSFRQNELR
jgi:hypothetical protein